MKIFLHDVAIAVSKIRTNVNRKIYFVVKIEFMFYFG